MQKVLYWNKIFGHPELLNHYQHQITRLLNGEYSEVGLEQLQGHKVFSIRINKSDRLLFASILVDGVDTLLLLDVVLNHDYDKNRFLKPAVLKQFLDKTLPNLPDNPAFQAITTEELSSCFRGNSQTTEGKEEIEEPSYQKVEFYNEHFISLSDIQNQACQTSLPLVISGAAGSGKSCVAFNLLAETVRQNEQDTDQTIYYITQSDRLVKHMQEIWEASSDAETPAGRRVKFMTYRQFLNEAAPELSQKKEHSRKDFNQWLTQFIAHQKKTLKLAKNIKLPSHDAIYQAFRYLSGYIPDNVNAISHRHNLFKDEHQRQWLINTYQQYNAHLNEHPLFNPDFYPLDTPIRRASKIIVDETQDLSLIQIKNLHFAAEGHQIVYCTDSNQNLFGEISSSPYLLSLPGINNQRIQHIKLPGTFRCSSAVIQVANALLAIKRQLIGGISDKDEYPFIEENKQTIPGEATWIEPLNPTDIGNLKAACKSARFAVITRPDMKQWVQKLYGTALVFTPDEIKGLEYDEIVLHDLFNHDDCKEASEQFKDEMSKSYLNRSKFEAAPTNLTPYLNELFTAVTRAKIKLHIVQKGDHKLDNLLNFIKKAIASLNKSNNNNNSTLTASTAEEWIKEAERLEAMGFKEQAQAIRQQLKQEANQPKSNATKVSDGTTDTGIKKPLPNIDEANGLVASLIQAFEKRTVLQSNRHFSTQSKLCRQLWLDIPIEKKGKQYPNLLVYSLRHFNKFNQVLGKIDLLDIYKKLFTSDLLKKIIDASTQKSLLYFMCEQPLRASLLYQIFDAKPHLLKECLPALCETHQLADNNNHSALFLFSTHHYHSLGLLTKYNLVKNIPAATWLKGNSIPELYFNLTFLDTLFIITHANKLITEKEMVNQANKILSELSQVEFKVDSLDFLYQNNNLLGNKEKTPLLEYLANFPSGCTLIYNWIKTNRSLAATIPLETWLMDDTMDNPPCSPLQMIFEYVETVGHPLLQELLDLYPNLPEKINPKELYTNLRAYPFCFLSVTMKTEDNFLYRLLTKNPDLILKIPARCWYETSLKDFPAVFFLSHLSIGRQLLICLLEKRPELATEIPLEAWQHEPDYKSYNFHHGLKKNPSPLYYLFNSDSGLNILNRLITGNPCFIADTPFKKWENAFKHKQKSDLILFENSKLPIDIESAKAFLDDFEQLGKKIVQAHPKLAPLIETIIFNAKKYQGFTSQTQSINPSFFSPHEPSTDTKPKGTIESENRPSTI